MLDRIRTVLLDPGHGGDDPGAVVGVTQEADLNLSVCLETACELSRRGVSVQMTRSFDKSATLADRLRMIALLEPAAFVSIHCNAVDDDPKTPTDERKTVHGFEIFYRDLGDVALAKCVQRVLVRTGSKDRGVHQDVEFLGKRLAVLGNLVVPSVLVEIGYLTYDAERKFIIEHQRQIAELLACGIHGYLTGQECLAGVV